MTVIFCCRLDSVRSRTCDRQCFIQPTTNWKDKQWQTTMMTVIMAMSSCHVVAVDQDSAGLDVVKSVEQLEDG